MRLLELEASFGESSTLAEALRAEWVRLKRIDFLREILDDQKNVKELVSELKQDASRDGKLIGLLETVVTAVLGWSRSELKKKAVEQLKADEDLIEEAKDQLRDEELRRQAVAELMNDDVVLEEAKEQLLKDEDLREEAKEELLEDEELRDEAKAELKSELRRDTSTGRSRSHRRNDSSISVNDACAIYARIMRCSH